MQVGKPSPCKYLYPFQQMSLDPSLICLIYFHAHIDKTCFEKFLNHEDMKQLHDRFIVYHILAPGQVCTPTFSVVTSLALVSEWIVILHHCIYKYPALCFKLVGNYFSLTCKIPHPWSDEPRNQHVGKNTTVTRLKILKERMKEWNHAHKMKCCQIYPGTAILIYPTIKLLKNIKYILVSFAIKCIMSNQNCNLVPRLFPLVEERAWFSWTRGKSLWTRLIKIDALLVKTYC